MFWELVGIGTFCYGLFYLIATMFIDCDVQLAFLEKFGKSIARMKGQVVFITGASSGIGEHTAYAFAKHGVKLVLAARRRDELERVKRQCLQISNASLQDNDILVLPFDLLDLPSHKLIFDRAIRHFGRIDVLFNNAGRSQRAMFENIDMRVHKELFELNVFSVINLSSIAVQHFLERGHHGVIAATSSMAGVMGVPYSASYTGSKHALHGYFDCLRNEKMDKHIHVTLCCPGPTFTNFLQESFTDTVGGKYGISTQPTDKRMSAERCGQLCAVAIANKTCESWMAVFPLIPATYLAVYFPILFRFIVKVVGPAKIFAFRDSKQPQLTENYS